MNKLIQTIKNIFKIEELRKRIVYTLLLLIIYRLGSFVVLPGIDAGALAAAESFRTATSEGLMGLLNMFSGGAFGNASIFALGVMPYISASIVIQLLGIFVPYFRRLQMEGESGRRKMNQYTRYLTIAIVLIQGFAYVKALSSPQTLPAGALLYPDSVLFQITALALLLGGTMFVMWLGERITDRGIGNGISLIIMIGIIARLPQAFFGEITMQFSSNGGGPLALIIELVVLFFVFVAAIAIVQAVRKVPVQYAKRVIGNKQYGGVRQYIPMKINAAGVMPIIFAQALMMIPMLFTANTMQYTDFWYNFIFAILVIAFTYFYTAVTINPTMMAEEMRKNNGFIPGVKPGRKTAEYLDSVMSRVTLPGSIFLALIAILPAFATMLGIEPSFAGFFGGTSLLILVGVVLDTLQQIESHLLMRHYDGLMKTGRLKGRSGM